MYTVPKMNYEVGRWGRAQPVHCDCPPTTKAATAAKCCVIFLELQPNWRIYFWTVRWPAPNDI